MTELVSVLLATRDRAGLLPRALRSLQCQRGVELEILVCDDGSIDATPRVLEETARRDARIRWIRHDRSKGLAAALNALIVMSRGRWLARMDDDDVAYPDRLAQQLQYMKSQSLHVCGTWYRRVAGWRRSIARPAVEQGRIVGELLFQPPLLHPSVMLRREVFELFGGYSENTAHAEDYEFWVRLLPVARFGNCPQVLMDYTLSGRQVSRLHQATQLQNAGILRVRALEQLGLKFSYEDAQIHMHLRDPWPIASLSELERIHRWLCKLHEQLRTQAQQAVRRQWFLQAVRAAGLGPKVFHIYGESPLAEASLWQKRILWGLCQTRMVYQGIVYRKLEPLAPLG